MAFRPGGDMIPQLDGQIERLKRKENLSEAEIIELCKTATKVLLSEQNMRNAPAPVVVVGDTHGQLKDLLWIFTTEGSPEVFIPTITCILVSRTDHVIRTLNVATCY